MKNFFLLFCCCLSVFASAQSNYYPFLTATNKWTNAYWGCGIYYQYSFVTNQDTVIDGNTYQKIGFALDQPQSFYLVREDVANQRVYLYNPNVQSERLLYDFGLEAGDTFDLVITEFSEVISYPHTVTSVDQVQMQDGSWRKRINLERLPYTATFSSDTVSFHYAWIEGMGCDTLSTFDYQPGGYNYGFLLCHKSKNTDLWNTAWGSEWGSNEYCDDPNDPNNTIHATGLTVANAATNISFFPNPTKEVLIVQLKEPVPNAELLLSNLQGQVVVQVAIGKNSIVELPTNNLPKGIYIVQISSNKQIIGTQKIFVE